MHVDIEDENEKDEEEEELEVVVLAGGYRPIVPTMSNYDWEFCESVTNSKAQAHTVTAAYSRCWPTGCSGLCTNRVTKPLIILIIQKRTPNIVPLLINLCERHWDYWPGCLIHGIVVSFYSTANRDWREPFETWPPPAVPIRKEEKEEEEEEGFLREERVALRYKRVSGLKRVGKEKKRAMRADDDDDEEEEEEEEDEEEEEE
ncbi:hypothetical protein V1477_000375 [Vespula maculifrons]|uniref:Uncharacterized protein n=1 Tax=Vespula maculifrons TaxID=7453 RepID=A0ABD2D1K3_VESMC